MSLVGNRGLVLQVRDFQAVIGKETRAQCMEQFGGKPDICIACVGGGSNAIGEQFDIRQDPNTSEMNCSNNSHRADSGFHQTSQVAVLKGQAPNRKGSAAQKILCVERQGIGSLAIHDRRWWLRRRLTGRAERVAALPTPCAKCGSACRGSALHLLGLFHAFEQCGCACRGSLLHCRPVPRICG